MPQAPRPTTSATPATQAPSWEWLTRFALFLGIALVIARAIMIEFARDPLPVMPATPDPPRSAGPAVSLVLNLLCWLPAMLVLLRAWLDRTWRLTWRWSHLLMAGLAVWTALSISWVRGDRFISLISLTHLVSALVMLWAVSQIVRDWSRVRLVAAVCFALLLVYLAQAGIYRYYEWPMLVETWLEQREERLRHRGWTEEDFHAQRFEDRILRGEMVGFAQSANTFAAVIVLFGIISAAVVVQRLAQRDEWWWPAVIAAALPVSLWVIWLTRSRTALLTPLLAAGLFLLIALLGRRLAAHARAAYFAGVLLVLAGIAAVIGFGITQGHLVHDSMTFRWQYWVASWHLWLDHWLIGVGWADFGRNYLAYRLPVAPEEIQDPHNFLVRYFTELGLIGGLLVIAWMLRLWWELTRPIIPPVPLQPGDDEAPPIIGRLVLLAVAGMVIHIAASVDLAMPGVELALELMKRLLFLCLLAIGLAVVTLRSSREQTLDSRPAPWVLSGLLIGLGIFLLHNLIDFSIFETGPMFIFALLVGAALGARSSATPIIPSRAAGYLLIGMAVLWIAGVIGILIPVARAEALAQAGDAQIRQNRHREAAQLYRMAFERLPYNADYAARAARTMIVIAAPPDDTIRMLDAAIQTNPRSPEYRLTRARYERARPGGDPQLALQHYRDFLDLDPADIRSRIEYADALQEQNLTRQAAEQLQLARWYNDQLHPDEGKRLRPTEVEQLEIRIQQLTQP